MTRELEGVQTRLQAGDVFIVKADQVLSSDEATRLTEMIAAALPEGVRVLVLDPGFTFSVMPRVVGVTRSGMSADAVKVIFRDAPHDDAVLALEELLTRGKRP